MKHFISKGELIALAWRMGFSVDRDTPKSVLEDLVNCPEKDASQLSTFDTLRKRISRIVRLFRNQLELDCKGDCWVCPAAQVVHCWLTSKWVVENLEGRVKMDTPKYTRAALEAMADTELWRIATTEAQLSRVEVYSMGREKLINAVLAKLGVEESVPTTESAEPSEPAKKAKPGRKKAKVLIPQPNDILNEKPQEEQKEMEVAPKADLAPAELIVQAIKELIAEQKVSGECQKHIEKIGNLEERIKKLEETLAKVVKALDDITASLEFLMELPDVEGDNPFDRLNDIGNRVREIE